MKSPLTSHYKPTSTSAPILSLFPLLVLEKSSLLLSKTSPSTYAPDPIPSRTLVNIAYCLPPLFPTPLINLSPQSAISLKTNSGLLIGATQKKGECGGGWCSPWARDLGQLCFLNFCAAFCWLLQECFLCPLLGTGGLANQPEPGKEEGTGPPLAA